MTFIPTKFASLLRDRAGWTASLAFAVFLCITALAYRPGLGGSLHFDDAHNLGGLSAVTDASSALRFVVEGNAGPLGRPLSLASFLPQAYAWPNHTEVFLRTNIALHLLNGVLVAWATLLLSIARRDPPSKAAWISALSASVWMLLPILASSSLLIVQRMTTLSATFALAGFVGYLYGRQAIERRPALAFFTMSSSVAVGTGLAVLAKENGALLPVLVLVTEATLLPNPTRQDIKLLWRAWRAVFLVLPTVLLAGYLAAQLPYGEATLLFRDFSGADRLLTQAHILWEYLFRAFLPTTSALGPFHDDHPVHRDWMQPRALAAVAAWIAIAIAAVRMRQRVPLFSFAAGWYLAGHAVESTTIPLELYFEHRNYIPLMGPVFAMVASLAGVPEQWQKVTRVALIAYSLVIGVALFNTTSLWGKPLLAAEIWTIYRPDSMRANQYLAQQLELSGDPYTARRVLRQHLEKHPEDVGVALQILALSCVLEPQEPHHDLLDRLEANLVSARFEHGVIETIAGLYRLARAERCNAVTRENVYRLAEITAENPSSQSVPLALHNLHVLMAEETFAQRNLDSTMRHLETALSARYTMTTLIFAVQALRSAGLQSAAEQFLMEAHEHEPRLPFRASAWRRSLAVLERSGGDQTSHPQK